VKSPEPSPDEQARESTTIAIRWLGYGMIVGLIVPILFATNTDDWWEWVETSSLAIVIAAAFACSGGLLGFLFGVPRALGRDSETVVTEAPATSGSSTPATSLSATDTAPAQRALYRSNTNLEEISDWLTKILVGVGLTQIATFPRRLRDLGEYLAPAFGARTGSEQFAVVLVIAYTVLGFLFSYLWTRMFLKRALEAADTVGVARIAERAALVVQQDRDELNRRAIELVTQQLEPSTGFGEVDQARLDEVLTRASAAVQMQVFSTARRIRKEASRAEGAEQDDLDRARRTIRVFRALIAATRERPNHRFYGQLAYALKDQPAAPGPEELASYRQALEALEEAIRLRDQEQAAGFAGYEFNRAICKIGLDPTRFIAPQTPSDPALRQAILRDLEKAAAEIASFQRAIAGSYEKEPAPPVSFKDHQNAMLGDWLRRNGILEPHWGPVSESS
jgi:hypothetical protein